MLFNVNIRKLTYSKMFDCLTQLPLICLFDPHSLCYKKQGGPEYSYCFWLRSYLCLYFRNDVPERMPFWCTETHWHNLVAHGSEFLASTTLQGGCHGQPSSEFPKHTFLPILSVGTYLMQFSNMSFIYYILLLLNTYSIAI